jgi:lipid-A-disaccharide synthase-like uncharacterized protein
MNRETVWLAIGFLGQGLFFMRFFVQWLASERKGKSHIPISFWYFSLGGSMILLTYAIYRLDPVFICGQLFGILVYVRNLQLIDRVKARPEAKN